jgi:hypothetical protein
MREMAAAVAVPNIAASSMWPASYPLPGLIVLLSSTALGFIGTPIREEMECAGRAEVDAGQRPGLTSEEHAEIKRLRLANEILKADTLSAAGAVASVGGVGDSNDDALAASTIGQLKTELVTRHGRVAHDRMWRS